ncbi:hypothetical protein, partial [Stenotrophomonas maltophilia]|uniref:hypothetical protein n=1 Tax=Stenotrophomonas maltophilia TaxID=40324 RepID=UPI0034E275DB
GNLGGFLGPGGWVNVVQVVFGFLLLWVFVVFNLVGAVGGNPVTGGGQIPVGGVVKLCLGAILFSGVGGNGFGFLYFHAGLG